MKNQTEKVLVGCSECGATRGQVDSLSGRAVPLLPQACCKLFAAFALIGLASLGLFVPAARAVEEICAACDQQVSVNGDFAHRKDRATVTIEGAGDNAGAFHEEINGKNFNVSIAHLPAGKYTVVIGEVETSVDSSGQRLFDVTSGEAVLARSFDILATAGDARKVTSIIGVVDHEDDSIKGALTISFAAIKGAAKFNTIEIRNSSGDKVIEFSASELADAFSAAATHAPDIKEAPIWQDPAQPLTARANDLIRRMSLAEKVAQLQNGAPGIPRIGLQAYNYWNEALHGVANNGIATIRADVILLSR